MPVFLSSAISRHVCFDESFTGSTSPYSPVRMPCFGSLLIAVDTNTRLPQTIGLETATPGTGVFHATFSPVGAFHFTAVGVPSAMPAAFAPRNDGQCCADSVAPSARQAKIVKTLRKRRMSLSLHAGVDDWVPLRQQRLKPVTLSPSTLNVTDTPPM